MFDDAKPASPVGLMIIMLMLAGSGLGTFFLLPVMFRSWTSSSWPTVQGTVISNNATSHESYSRRGSKTVYKIDIRYEYTVNGTQYVGERLRLGSLREGTGAAFESVAALQPGNSVVVSYNPNDPRDSFLVKENALWMTIGGAIVVVMFFVSIMALIEQIVASTRPKHKKRKRSGKRRTAAGH